MTNLAKGNAAWLRFLGREFSGAFLAPIRELRELRDKFTRERTQIIPLNLNGNLTALTLSGVNYGTNTSVGGELWARFTANGGNWDVGLYTAAGASGLVAHVTNVADGATSALTADNSSGLSGSLTLGAAVVAVADDLYKLLVVQDYPARMPYIFTGTDAIEDDKFSRAAAEAAYAVCAQKCQEAINALKAAVTKWAISDPPLNPVGRGNEFNSTGATTLSEDVAVPDQSSGNVSRRRTGLFTLMADNMADEATGSEQDVVRRVIAAGAGSFDGDNSGQGTVASHTPMEKTPVALWTFECVRGSDTGDLGREEFAGSAQVTDGSGESTIFFSGLRVEKDWSGPRGLGSIRLRRTYSKTGDGSNLNFAAVTTGLVNGENNNNTDDGTLYWKVDDNGSNFDFSFYSSSARTSSVLVSKATNVAASAAINATSQNGSGMTVTWTAGSAPVADATGTLLLQPFLTQNSANKPDKFTITTSLTGTAGLIQELVGEVFDAQLNSDSSGSEAISDNYAKQGTFAPFIAQDN